MISDIQIRVALRTASEFELSIEFLFATKTTTMMALEGR